MIPEPLSTIQSIQEAVKQDPSLRVSLAKKYLGLGGTLSNGAIPLPPETDGKEPLAIFSRDGKATVEEAKNKIAGFMPPEKPTPENPKETPEKPITETKGGLTFDEAISLFGQDFTGIQQQPDGTYVPDKTALERLGIKSKESETETALEQSKVELEGIKNQLAGFLIPDAEVQQQISNISAQWDARANEMRDINRRREAALMTTGLRLGSQYTGGLRGGVFGSIISEEERQAVARISDLEAKKQEAIIAAKQAQRENNYTVLVKQADLLEKAYSKQLDEIKDMNKLQADKAKELREKEKEELEKTGKLQDQNQKKIEGLGKTILNSLTGDEATDVSIIKGFADTYDLDANFLLNEILKQDQEKTKKELLTKEIGGSLYTYNPATQKWDLSIEGKDETKELRIESLRLDIEKKKQELKNIAGVQELPVDDPIFYVVAGIKSELGKNNAIKRYTGMIKEGKIAEAKKFVDTLAFQNLGAPQKEDYGVYSDGERIINNVLADTEKFKQNNLSLYKTAVERAKPFISLQKDQKWVDITSKIEQAQARIRKGFFGTALTGTEKASAEQFLINFSRDDIATAETKLKNMAQLATDIKTRLLNEQKGIFEENIKPIKIKNVKTDEIEDYFGELTPEEAKQAGFEII